ncbi:molecular chaperone [Pseudomonas mosselii]|uniref:molecular chaperone n=1 Tax=Pseudomonas mosselii TaxID=78327 RepID=UPI002DB58EE3|nr:molecular chaperone [Pseudomonas mosselii]MEB5932395.1 molecular chaperone [Pseudomonas mosselii]
MKKFIFGCALLWLGSAACAGPNINVGTIYDYMEGDKSTYLKRVFNAGDSTAFVRINIFEMVFSADGKTTEVPLHTDGPGAALRNGLIASPARLIVPASGMQATRLVYMGDRDRERYYRVRFVPVVPEKEDQFAVSDQERETYKTAMSAGVNVLTGYGTVFFVRPKDTRFATKIQDGDAEYRVDNTGNTTIELADFKDCSVSQAQECAEARKHIVLPGRHFSFVKAPGRKYSFNLVEGAASKSIKVGEK